MPINVHLSVKHTSSVSSGANIQAAAPLVQIRLAACALTAGPGARCSGWTAAFAARPAAAWRAQRPAVRLIN